MTVRELLKKWLADKDLKAILFGEYHLASYTDALIIANLDLFLNCKRPIVFLPESFNQADNATLIAASKKKNPSLIKRLNTLKFLSSPTLFFATALISNGLEVRGTESKKTNPFMDMDWDEIDLEAGKLYESSDQRITEPNLEFAQVANEYIAKGYLVIFIGGAIHPVALTQDDQPFDPGIKGRILGKAISVNLVEASKDAVRLNTKYQSVDHRFQGTYDYIIESIDDSMYKQSFMDCKNLDEKKAKLNQIILALFKTREYFPTTKGTFNYFMGVILKNFKASIGDSSLSFDALNNFLSETALQANSSEKSSGHSFMHFFSNTLPRFMALKPSLEDTIKQLIDQDLQPESEKYANNRTSAAKLH